MDKLPGEIIIRIILFLDPSDIGSLARTCWTLRAFSGCDAVWSELIRRDFSHHHPVDTKWVLRAYQIKYFDRWTDVPYILGMLDRIECDGVISLCENLSQRYTFEYFKFLIPIFVCFGMIRFGWSNVLVLTDSGRSSRFMVERFWKKHPGIVGLKGLHIRCNILLQCDQQITITSSQSCPRGVNPDAVFVDTGILNRVLLDELITPMIEIGREVFFYDVTKRTIF